MKTKILNLLLLISSLFGYLEWGTDNHAFLFESEREVFAKLFTEPQSVAHPFVLIPLLGQLLLFITLFQKKPSRMLTYIAIGSLGLLLGLMFVIGLMGFKIKILLSTLPFLALAGYTIYYRKSGNN